MTHPLSQSRKAVAIALNYTLHAAEMQSIPIRTTPIFFFKPSTSYLPPSSGPIILPKNALIHHEIELGVVIASHTSHIPASEAISHIKGYVAAIDITARDWQTAAKAAGHPWSLSKGCDTFLPYSAFIPAHRVPIKSGVVDVGLYLDVNGVRRQTGRTKDMIWNVAELLERVSEHVTLEENDLLLTGTPAGVGEIRPGDRITAGIEGLVEFTVDAVAG